MSPQDSEIVEQTIMNWTRTWRCHLW